MHIYSMHSIHVYNTYNGTNEQVIHTIGIIIYIYIYILILKLPVWLSWLRCQTHKQ